MPSRLCSPSPLSHESLIVTCQRRQTDKLSLIIGECKQLGAFLRGQELAARHRQGVAKTRGFQDKSKPLRKAPRTLPEVSHNPS